MMKKILFLFFGLQLLVNCGYTPVLKVTEYQNNTLVTYEINPNNYYQARQALNSTIHNLSDEKTTFITKVNIIEKESAVNIMSSGAVSEYRVEILINFEIFHIESNDLIYKSQSRGFANYDISNSEYNNKLLKKEALKQALSDGMKLMNIIVQSKIN
jgi:hypothetical protein